MILLNEAQCIGCGRCVDVCPSGFKMKEDKAVVINQEADCISQAIAVCPVGAIVYDDASAAPGMNQGSVPFPGQSTAPGSFPGGVGGGGGRGMGGGTGRGMGRGTGRGLGIGPRDGRGGGRGGGGRRGR